MKFLCVYLKNGGFTAIKHVSLLQESVLKIPGHDSEGKRLWLYPYEVYPRKPRPPGTSLRVLISYASIIYNG